MTTRLRFVVDPEPTAGHRVNLRHGFTLVEMLATVAIIAILVIVCLPYLSTGKLKAKDARCIMNLRQLGLAQHLYASDFHDRFVYSGHGWWVTPLLEYPILLRPYLGSRSTNYLQCPAETGTPFNFLLAAIKAPSAGKTVNDITNGCSYYYYQPFYCDLAPDTAKPAPHTSAQVAFPARKAMVACFASSVPGRMYFFELMPGPSYAANVHSPSGINMLFADGRARFTDYTNCIPRNTAIMPRVPPYNYDWSGLNVADVK